ncbi:helix-turn-helix domain-containing protein (plasmid) [Cetobacterium somerae]|uniref:helix-turn-helix domain-containing protein n=1 Tax=Cetobacterium somerae TaxID=188913 RepID=UPI003D7682D7
MKIGEKIKNIRKSKGYSIQYLSVTLNLSVGFISNLERDKTSPTIDILEKICNLLEVDIFDILKKEKYEFNVSKSQEREIIFENEDSQISYKNMIHRRSRINGIEVKIDGESHFSKISWGHTQDEFCIIILGFLEVELGTGEKVLLEKGDTIYIEKGISHRHRNPKNIPSITYWFSIN